VLLVEAERLLALPGVVDIDVEFHRMLVVMREFVENQRSLGSDRRGLTDCGLSCGAKLE